jgi:tRNA (cmo5U34)-methyltransferase
LHKIQFIEKQIKYFIVNNNKDTIFQQQFQAVKAFAFDQQVTDVFEDMIKRSVPGYDSILKSIAMFCMQYAQEDTNIYDLGCSLGAVAMTAALSTKEKNCHVIGVDTSAPMLEKCQKLINEKGLNTHITLLLQDIIDLPMNKASVVVSNFTLQFIPKADRLAVIENIYQGLEKGGVFILSEKFKGDAKNDAFLIDHYHAYKKLNGYTNKEIQRKRSALKDVLIPDSLCEIENRLTSAGFKQTIKWFQCFNFASFIAIKD